MGLRINTNTASINAQRNLKSQVEAESSSIEKLSSGSRINHAGDDAAGLSISENMRAQARSNQQAVRNMMDGVSMVQVAEGATSEISSMLIRMRELSIQSASDTIGDHERGMLDQEVQQLVKEVTRVSSAVEYNGQKLMNTGPKYLEIQAGTHDDADVDRLYYDVWKGNSSAETLGISGISVASKGQAQSNLDSLDHAINRVSKSRASLGALQNRIASAVQSGNVYGENLTASESRIKDADYALETSEMTKNKIRADASVAVLSQANQSGKLALKLLE